MAQAARKVIRARQAVVRHLRVRRRADRKPEAEEQRVDAREAHTHGPGHDVARRELEAAHEHDEALRSGRVRQ